jgi:hypothetical protein
MTSLEMAALGLPDDAASFFKLPDDYHMIQEQCRTALESARRTVELGQMNEDWHVCQGFLKTGEKLVLLATD